MSDPKDWPERIYIANDCQWPMNGYTSKIDGDVEYIRADLAALDVEKLAKAICKTKGSLWYDGPDDAIDDARAIIEELKK